MSGYFGIGIYHYHHECNVGTLFRSAYAFDASFIFTIGRKYQRQSSDTPNTKDLIPYYNYQSTEKFLENLPKGCRVVCVEQTDNCKNLPEFTHPRLAVYLLGNEIYGIPKNFMEGKLVVQIPSNVCLNVSTAGSIVLYDRVSKLNRRNHDS